MNLNDFAQHSIWYVLLTLPLQNIITDVIILVLPISTVLSLHMPLHRKIAVLCVIGFGSSSVLISMLRFIILHKLGSDPDISYVLGEMVIIAALEIEFAVIAVNLPPMKALWNRLTGGTTSASGADGYSGPNGYSGAKAYKLSRTGGSYGHSKLDSSNQLELTSIDSKRELYFPAENSKDIKVTTNLTVSSGARPDSDSGQGEYNSTFSQVDRV